MQFKRSKGNFRETDRVVRFKLIKSGKNWLRASTAALGLFRVVRGQVEETIIANVQQDQIESQKHNQAFLKGLITVGTVFGGAVLATTAKAEDATSLAPTVSETKQETLAEVDSVVLGIPLPSLQNPALFQDQPAFLHLWVHLLQSVNPLLCPWAKLDQLHYQRQLASLLKL